MGNFPPVYKEVVINNEMMFDWEYGKEITNIIVENTKINVQILRYKIINENKRPLYDTIAIKASKSNTILLVRNQKKEIGLIWEWRPIPEKWFWACIRGFGNIGDHDNITTAKRELFEEIGIEKVVENRELGFLFPNTTFFEDPVGLVLLDVETMSKKFDRNEGITDFKFFEIEEIVNMIRNGKIEDTLTLSAIMKYIALETSQK